MDSDFPEVILAWIKPTGARSSVCESDTFTSGSRAQLFKKFQILIVNLKRLPDIFFRTRNRILFVLWIRNRLRNADKDPRWQFFFIYTNYDFIWTKAVNPTLCYCREREIQKYLLIVTGRYLPFAALRSLNSFTRGSALNCLLDLDPDPKHRYLEASIPRSPESPVVNTWRPAKFKIVSRHWDQENQSDEEKQK